MLIDRTGAWHARHVSRHWALMDFHTHRWNKQNPTRAVKRTVYGKSSIDRAVIPQVTIRKYGGAFKREALSLRFRQYRDVDQSPSVAAAAAACIAEVSLGDIVVPGDEEVDDEFVALYLNACALFTTAPKEDILQAIPESVLPRSSNVLAVESILATLATTQTIPLESRRMFWTKVNAAPAATELLMQKGSCRSVCLQLYVQKTLQEESNTSNGMPTPFHSLSPSGIGALYNRIITLAAGQAQPITLSEILLFAIALTSQNATGARTQLVVPPSCVSLLPIILPVVVRHMDQLWPAEAVLLFCLITKSATALPPASGDSRLATTVAETLDALAHRIYIHSDLVSSDTFLTALVLSCIVGSDAAVLRYRKLPKALIDNWVGSMDRLHWAWKEAGPGDARVQVGAAELVEAAERLGISVPIV